MKYLTVSMVGERVGMTAPELNKLLEDLGLIERRGADIFSLTSLGHPKEFGDKRYVVYEEGIIDILMAKDAEKKAEVITLTATVIAAKLAEELNLAVTAKLVNRVLVDVQFMDKNEKGFFSNHPFAQQCITADGKTYVKWSKDILTNEVFIREIKAATTETAEVEAPVASKPVKGEVNVDLVCNTFKFDRKTFEATFRTDSGHFVRSRAEMLVANWLYHNNVMFAYEKRVPIVEEMYSDFFIKDKKIYIEVWGLESTKYLERKAKKISMYKEHGFTLLGLEDSDIENIDDMLPLKLAQLGIVF